MSVDLLIRGGTVYDGTGAAPVERDVLVNGGRVEALVRRGAPVTAARVLDAAGCAVAPGFIDIHTHSDVSLLLDGRAESKIHQGVTTEVVGNCGFSAFPLSDPFVRDHLDLLAGIGDDPVEPSWSDLDGYAAAVERAGVALNVVPLVGHGQLRIAAAGLGEEMSASTLDTMRSTLAQLLEQGAFGLSTGLTYVPSRYAGTTELEALCAVLAEYGALYATHARGRGFDDVTEAAALGRATGARVQHSHVALNEPDSWGRAPQLLEIFEAARDGGVDVACDVYPYDASASALTQYLPPWVQEGGVEAMRRRLADPSTMRRATEDLAAGWGEGSRIPWFWDRVVLARAGGDAVELPGAPSASAVTAMPVAPEGATIEQAAAEAGMPEAQYVVELCRAGGNRVQVVLFYRTEEDMRAFLRYPHTTVGSDGSAIPFEQHGRRPHPRAFGAHARVLSRYVRDVGDLDLPVAVHKMTGAVAKRLGLVDRGTLRPGQAADVVVFDPRTVRDQATFLDPCRAPSGIEHVLVNGAVAVERGVQTPERHGRVLRAR